MLLACSFVTMNRYYFIIIFKRIGLLYILSIPALFVYAAINYNNILYKSDRLGGDQTITGALFFIALCFAIIDGVLKPKKIPI